jgi:hypothetical protein
MRPVLCACGSALHYNDPSIEDCVQRAIDALGATIAISTFAGTWCVPRHVIALHGLDVSALPRLARLYHWERKDRQVAQ